MTTARLGPDHRDGYADLRALGVPIELCAPLRSGHLQQSCSACGRSEAAHWYCSGCLRRTGPADWHRHRVSGAQLAARKAAGRQRGHREPVRATRNTKTAKTGIPAAVA